MTLLTLLAVTLAVWLWLDPPVVERLQDERGERRSTRTVRRLADRLWPFAGVAAATVAGGLARGGAGAAIGFALALPAVSAVAVWRRHRARNGAMRRRKEVHAACQLLAGLLRVGHVPSAALGIAARDAPVLAEAAAMLRVGSPVGAVLRRQGALPGGSGLAELAVAWEVAERTGASLTATLDALAERLVATQATQDVIAAELSAPRATGRLLAALPLVGLALGYGFGGDPVAFLTGSLPGQLSLVFGVALGCAGVFWTERIAETGES